MRSAAVALLVLLAACGDGAAPATSARPPATTVAATTLPEATTTTALPLATTSTTAAPTVTIGTTKTVPAPEYVFPVGPPANYGPDHHDYPATDIFAPVGTPVFAVTGGIVDELSRIDVWDPSVNDPATRGGLYFSLVGDDGVRYYYSHFDEVLTTAAAGDRVEAGELIGTVGNSGNARNTPSHIHFGISPPTSPGDWEIRRGTIPPYDYLQMWAEGVDATPALGN